MTLHISSNARRTVLVTGASGVVGQAVIARLLATANVTVVALVHRSAYADGRVDSVHGDITRPRLGMTGLQYRALTARIDAVIHCAAVVDLNRADGTLEATNIDGTRRILDLTSAAAVPLYHVSTAYVNARDNTQRDCSGVRYAESKRLAEAMISSSDQSSVILRPSIVIGDSRSGEIAAFQGIYQMADAFIRGLVPVLPFDRGWTLDTIPQDIVADTIVRVVEKEIVQGEYWITAGQRALTLEQVVGIGMNFAADIGLRFPRPRFLEHLPRRSHSASVAERLTPRARHVRTLLMDVFDPYLTRTPLPTSLPVLEAMGVTPLPDPAETLSTSLQHWFRTTASDSDRAGA